MTNQDSIAGAIGPKLVSAALRRRIQPGATVVRTPGLTKDDPTYIRMGVIVRSKEEIAAAVKVALAGIPALCGVGPPLHEALGTASAGD